MRKVIAFLLVLILCISVVGCARNEEVLESEPKESAPAESESLESEPEEQVEDLSLVYEPLFRGIIDLEERDGAYGDPKIGGGAFVPMRFSHERIKSYEQYSAIAKVGTPYFNCTTGVRMDFYTDAKEISFSYYVKETFFDRSADHPDDCFALYENGELKGTYLVQYGTNTDLVYEREATEESRITIVFPGWHGVILRNFNLGNARPYEEYDHSFLFLGDSITQGLFADNPGENWAHIVASHYNADYINLSVGGEVFRNGAVDRLANFKPTHIIISLGENDYYSGVPEDQMAQNCRRYIAEVKAKYPDIPVTVVSSFNYDKPESWTASMLAAANEQGCNTIEGTLMASADADSWNIDRVHPSSKGFKEIAENMIPALSEYIG